MHSPWLDPTIHYDKSINLSNNQFILTAIPAYNKVDDTLNFVSILENNNFGTLISKSISSNKNFTINSLQDAIMHPERTKPNQVTFSMDNSLIKRCESKTISLMGSQKVNYTIVHAELKSVSHDKLVNDLYIVFRDGKSDGMTALTYLLDKQINKPNTVKLLNLMSNDNLLGLTFKGISVQGNGASINLYPDESDIYLNLNQGLYTFKDDTGQAYLDDKAIINSKISKVGLRSYTLTIKTKNLNFNVFLGA